MRQRKKLEMQSPERRFFVRFHVLENAKPKCSCKQHGRIHYRAHWDDAALQGHVIMVCEKCLDAHGVTLRYNEETHGMFDVIDAATLSTN